MKLGEDNKMRSFHALCFVLEELIEDYYNDKKLPAYYRNRFKNFFNFIKSTNKDIWETYKDHSDTEKDYINLISEDLEKLYFNTLLLEPIDLRIVNAVVDHITSEEIANNDYIVDLGKVVSDYVRPNAMNVLKNTLAIAKDKANNVEFSYQGQNVKLVSHKNTLFTINNGVDEYNITIMNLTSKELLDLNNIIVLKVTNEQE